MNRRRKRSRRRSAPVLRVLALGPLQVFAGDRAIDSAAWGSARPRELLVYLMMHPDGRTKEQVGLAFWPEASAAQLRNSFHVTLHRLRKALGNRRLDHARERSLRVDPSVVAEFDVADFERDRRGGAQDVEAAGGGRGRGARASDRAIPRRSSSTANRPAIGISSIATVCSVSTATR